MDSWYNYVLIKVQAYTYVSFRYDVLHYQDVPLWCICSPRFQSMCSTARTLKTSSVPTHKRRSGLSSRSVPQPGTETNLTSAQTCTPRQTPKHSPKPAPERSQSSQTRSVRSRRDQRAHCYCSAAHCVAVCQPIRERARETLGSAWRSTYGATLTGCTARRYL